MRNIAKEIVREERLKVIFIDRKNFEFDAPILRVNQSDSEKTRVEHKIYGPHLFYLKAKLRPKRACTRGLAHG